MKWLHSIRFRLTLLFLATIVFPVALIVMKLPDYYSSIIAKQAKALTDNTLTALTYNIETYLDDLDRMTIAPYLNNDVMAALKLKASRQYAEASAYSKMQAEIALAYTLPKFLNNTRKDILGVILLPFDGSVYVTSPSGTTESTPDFAFSRQIWYRKAVESDGNVAFISAHVQDYISTSLQREVFSVARLIKDPDSQKPLAVIMADADTILLAKMINGVRFDNRSIVAVMDDHHNLLYSNYPLSSDVLAKLAAQGEKVTSGGETYSVVKKTISRSNWSIAVLFPDSVIRAQLSWIYWVGLLFAAGGLLIALLLFFTVSHWIVTPFKQMIHVMKKVQRGDLTSRYRARGHDEIAQLGASLNTMIAQLEELIDREYKAVLGQRVADYRALQSQIQPHFLYNTLSGFIGLNRTGQSQLLEKAILSLSGLLRYILGHNDWSLLRDELDFIAKYCELQRIRFQERLQFRIELEAGLEEIKLPKLLLQPLVENAIIHGIEPLFRPCTLTVAASRRFRRFDHSVDSLEEEVLEIQVADDGAGFDAAAGGESVGLSNVRERLKLAYGRGMFRIDSAIGQGTTASIIIPWKDVSPL
ncbi:cache domain-containing sensor histidine kinase [Paenibacillus hamazuiensis]|uniref:cache domain-containing sensor histidine kinase n=1 Tax=Paenibacillus hamazuiensis TaxID=2936508 RepID=UPI00200E08E1|nr:sensor histidine kinase [Paenibacillus hamazuiensis]